jgi:hypothetical protein
MNRAERWAITQILGRTPRRYPVRRTGRNRPHVDEQYKAWVRTLPSVVSGAYGCDAAHTGSDGGMGYKAHDKTTVPLTRKEHIEYHRIGRRAFEAKYMISFDAIVERLNAQYAARGGRHNA